MELGLHIADFTFPNGAPGLRDDLTRIVTTAEEVGFAKVSVIGPPAVGTLITGHNSSVTIP